MRRVLTLLCLGVVSSCVASRLIAEGALQPVRCVLAARYESGSVASARAHDFIARNLIAPEMLEEGSFARTFLASARFVGPGDGKIALAFTTDCDRAREFLVTRFEQLQAQAEDAEVRNQLQTINGDWHPITEGAAERVDW